MRTEGKDASIYRLRLPWKAKRREWAPATLATLTCLLAAFVGAPGAGITVRTGLGDPDMWWHLATGELILRRGIPRIDPFSWTAAGEPWVAHEWGSEAIFAIVQRVVGAPGLLVLSGLLIGAAFVILRRTLRRVTDNEWAVAVALSAALFLSVPMWTLRPHVFSIVFLTLFLDALIAYRNGQPWMALWALVPLTALWANLHGAFVSGVLLVWIFAIAGALERRSDARRLGVLALIVTLAGAASPHGLAIYPFALHLASLGTGISEWHPPGLRDPYGIVFALIALGTPVAAAYHRFRCDRAVLAAAFVFGLLGFAAIRSVWSAGIVIAPLLASVLAQTRRLPRPGATSGTERALLRIAAYVLCLAGLAFVWANLSGKGDSELLGEQGYPKQAVEVLATKPAGRLVNPYDWGGYLIWKLPEFPVSIDGRADMYGPELLQQAFRLETGKPGWRTFLDERDVSYVLWQRDRALAELLRLAPGWDVAYEDDVAILFERSSR